MDIWGICGFDCFPYAVDAIVICELVEDAVTAQKNKVVRVVDLEASNFWLRDYDCLRLHFCFKISKSSAHGESARENSDWADNYLRGCLPSCIVKTCRNSSSLIDLAATFKDSSLLKLIIWLVILR